MDRQQAKQKEHHDRHSRYRELSINQPVWIRNFRDAPRWLQGVVVDRVGPLSYLVRLPDGNLWRRHIDHLRDSHEVMQSPRHGDDQPHPSDSESVAAEGLQPIPVKEASDTMESRGSIVEQNTDRRNKQSNRTTADSESAHLQCKCGRASTSTLSEMNT